MTSLESNWIHSPGFCKFSQTSSQLNSLFWHACWVIMSTYYSSCIYILELYPTDRHHSLNLAKWMKLYSWTRSISPPQKKKKKINSQAIQYKSTTAPWLIMNHRNASTKKPTQHEYQIGAVNLFSWRDLSFHPGSGYLDLQPLWCIHSLIQYRIRTSTPHWIVFPVVNTGYHMLCIFFILNHWKELILPTRPDCGWWELKETMKAFSIRALEVETKLCCVTFVQKMHSCWWTRSQPSIHTVGIRRPRCCQLGRSWMGGGSGRAGPGRAGSRLEDSPSSPS